MCHLLRARGSMYRDPSAVFTVPGSAETIQCPELDTDRGCKTQTAEIPRLTGLGRIAKPVQDVGAGRREAMF
jgi:hypothetical protein